MVCFIGVMWVSCFIWVGFISKGWCYFDLWAVWCLLGVGGFGGFGCLFAKFGLVVDGWVLYAGFDLRLRGCLVLLLGFSF